ncbi:uncharacterized protein MONOS_1373 [Monocercomonoides exilis]|uniref:uncharacterized protein n=1 Tax=Monocercomonoides exilis TaxID=2049356 RepID=UPI00355A35E6|nr:hypothetical protein MONOS_1373 [Monocercomonoides exilis]|eukprot:MONOS_1373.1-p1 / transcript=MONOS_1373.1 / gene=MONOS_1373 / organism=Monocercomonoides_exilis_PA203 / gene_product=unspecified product / transcript_product=unspecified product / location=Mono_scaffold00023:214506-214801(-) / protein_length=72 / sequence_SO=supercontig / SO=protein_coding / is_pseudo=false
MSSCDDNDIRFRVYQEMCRRTEFSMLFNELEDCPEMKQKRKIEEMNEIIDEMGEVEFQYVFTGIYSIDCFV